MTDRRELGTFTDPDGLIALLRARKDELGLSNPGFEKLCLFAAGQADKYLGPTREKSPTLWTLITMMDALGVSGALYVDPAKVARLSKAWAREGRRRASGVRESTRVSKLMVKRARPEVLRERARHAALSRWAATTPEQRVQISEYMNHCRWGKRRKLRASTEK